MAVLALLFATRILPRLPLGERGLHQFTGEGEPFTACRKHLKFVAIATQIPGRKVRFHAYFVRRLTGVRGVYNLPVSLVAHHTGDAFVRTRLRRSLGNGVWTAPLRQVPRAIRHYLRHLFGKRAVAVHTEGKRFINVALGVQGVAVRHSVATARPLLKLLGMTHTTALRGYKGLIHRASAARKAKVHRHRSHRHCGHQDAGS
jgi:hypothetical protein